MEISLYQINHDRDAEGAAFMSLHSLRKLTPYGDVNPKIYDKVFDGNVSCESLEDVYTMFNWEHPDSFSGRSMSVSDVVEVKASDTVEPGMYFCDSFGFTKIDFDAPVEASKTMRVIYAAPGREAKVLNIDPSVESLQSYVRGYFEAVFPFEEPVALLCNEEGKLNDMPLNRPIYNSDKEIVDIISGPMLITGLGAEDFCSLSDDLLEKYLNQFKDPQKFFMAEGKICSCPVKRQPAPER